jgi:hypothetical protein
MSGVDRSQSDRSAGRLLALELAATLRAFFIGCLGRGIFSDDRYQPLAQPCERLGSPSSFQNELGGRFVFASELRQAVVALFVAQQTSSRVVLNANAEQRHFDLVFNEVIKNGFRMLRRLHPRAAYCLERAEENHLKGKVETDPHQREKYFDLEWRWRCLAESYDVCYSPNENLKG